MNVWRADRRGVHRRGGRAYGLADAGPVAGAIVGVDGFSTANYYGGAGNAGSDTMSVAVLCRVDATPTGTEAIYSRWNTNGWTLGADASGFFFRIASTLSPQRAITAADHGKWFLLVGTHDAVTVRLYVQGVQIGSGTPVVGSDAVAGMADIGRQGAGIAGQGAVSFAAAAAASHVADVKDATENASIYDAAFLAGDLADADWQARYSVADDGGGTPATLTDQVGTADKTLTGTVTAVSDATPTWGA